MRSQSLETDIAYLKDMVLYLDKADAVLYKARRYNLPLDDDMVVDSIAMNLGQVGEQLLLGKLSEEVKQKYSDRINWTQIKGFRNFIYHNYSNLNFKIIEGILKESVPKTKESLHSIIRELEGEL
ncbi:HepT-like ribonuclease domain-containing protein [Streptococcus sp. 1969]|uniref:HepT-like ribonuclease domain-containing protein n=1 Tax=Streptococcus sp. 1969 TaxID=2582688 RepID=UPI001561F414|nr:HepT-like ribonuclease domain-containing protein [Streptococcus sp. 1969]